MHTHHRIGFTISELLVVVVIVALLAGLLIPNLRSGGKSQARELENKNNLKQIGMLLVAYENDYGSLPAFTGAQNQRLLGSEQAGEAVFELLASTMQMSHRLFNNRMVRRGVIQTPARDLAAIQYRPADGWAQTIGPDGVSGRTSYMYDPTIPSTGAAIRPILGDDINQNPWTDTVHVVHGDMHVETLPLIDPDTDAELHDLMYRKPDDRPLLWGAGSTTRAWLH